MNLPKTETSLSPYVHKLITEAGNPCVSDGKSYINSNGCIVWDEICLPPNTESAGNIHQYFKNCVESLSPIIHEAEKLLSTEAEDILWSRYEERLYWIKKEHKHIFREVVSILSNRDSADDILALQLLTSILEHALGDVYENIGSQPCPSLLKDILNSTEIQQALGEKTVKILQVVIGPPTSLNLRNVVWHGFLNPGEISRRYCWFIWLVFPSLGEILKEHDITELTHRELSTLSITPDYLSQIPENSSQIDVLVELFEQSGVFCNRKPVLKRALWYLRTNQHAYSAVLLLPQLEYVMRLVFVSANKCPQRLLTAEATTLYTTFDEILDIHLSNGEENKTSEAVGENIMDMLFDILVYPQGPRVRDKVGHGELDLLQFPRCLTSMIFTILAAIGLRCGDEKTSPYTEIQDYVSQYTSYFHPMSIVRQKIIKIINLTSTLDSCILYNKDLVERKSDGLTFGDEEGVMFKDAQTLIKDIVATVCVRWQFQITCDDIMTCLFQNLSDGKDVVKKLMREKLSTLYRFQRNQNDMAIGREAEIIGLLIRILKECELVLEQLLEVLKLRQEKLEAKQLRSRQRDNLVRLIKRYTFTE